MRSESASLIRAALLAGLAGALHAAAAPPPAASTTPVRVPVDGFGCHAGRYALALPRHYPTLLNIGRHRVVELEARQRGSERVITRRIEYIGMRLEVVVSSTDPSRYAVRSVEVWSRRWNIGRLSVGARPWSWWGDKWPAKTPPDGLAELVGDADAVLLALEDGRIARVTYRCQGAVPA